MDTDFIESLFLEVPELTEGESKALNEQIASLGGHSALRRLIRVRHIASIIDVLSFVSSRRFEEAFAECKSLESWNELFQSIQEARESVERENIPKRNMDVKEADAGARAGVKY